MDYQDQNQLPDGQSEVEVPLSPLKKAMPWLVNAAVGLVLAAVACVLRELHKQESVAEVMRVLADAFFVPGVVLACVYVLRRLARGGMFFGLGYVGSYCLHALFPITAADRKGKAQGYGEWCEKRIEKNEKKGKVPLAQVLTGALMILIGAGFTVAYLLLSR